MMITPSICSSKFPPPHSVEGALLIIYSRELAVRSGMSTSRKAVKIKSIVQSLGFSTTSDQGHDVFQVEQLSPGCE